MTTAISDVGESLVDLLTQRLPNDDKPVVLCTPAEVKDTDAKVGIFLYSIAPAADVRNEFEIPFEEGNTVIAEQPLDLYYLITCYPATPTAGSSETTYQAHRRLGLVMQILFDNSTLTGSLLRGHIPPDQEIRLTHQPITVEDVTRIWGGLPNISMQTSVSYLASPVRIRSDRGVPGARVQSRRADLAPMEAATV